MYDIYLILNFRSINRIFNFTYKYIGGEGKINNFGLIKIIIIILFLLIVEVPYIFLLILYCLIISRFKYSIFKTVLRKFLEKNHYDCRDMRIVFDGEKLYLNSYDIIKKTVSKLFGLSDYKSLCLESFIVDKSIIVENKTLINNINGTIYKHGLVRVRIDDKFIDLTMTHTQPQISMKEDKFLGYFHLSKNSDDCVINKTFRDRCISNRIYNLLLVSDIHNNPNNM